MLKLLYFARLREELGTAGEDLAYDAGLTTAGALAARLAERGGAWAALAADRRVRVAVNQSMADASTPLREGDEVAFFPPVTGG